MITFKVTYDASRIPGWIDRMNNNVDAAVQQSAEVMAAFARGEVAVDTGSLRDTIDVEKDTDRSTPTNHAYQVSAGNLEGGFKGGGKYGKPAGTPVDYAIDQEYGGSGAHQPYMTPASEQGAIEAPPLVGSAIRLTT